MYEVLCTKYYNPCTTSYIYDNHPCWIVWRKSCPIYLLCSLLLTSTRILAVHLIQQPYDSSTAVTKPTRDGPARVIPRSLGSKVVPIWPCRLQYSSINIEYGVNIKLLRDIDYYFITGRYSSIDVTRFRDMPYQQRTDSSVRSYFIVTRIQLQTDKLLSVPVWYMPCTNRKGTTAVCTLRGYSSTAALLLCIYDVLRSILYFEQHPAFRFFPSSG